MTGAERGYLLLGSNLGNPERRCLTGPQLRRLSQRVQAAPPPQEDRELASKDLLALGYSPEEARRILALLSEEDLLDYYLEKGRKAGCVPLSRVSPGYPQALKDRLGLYAPASLWAKGDMALLQGPMISLAGSRDLKPENEAFAVRVGREAARQGYVLVSGNARGADTAAQTAALEVGGGVISVLAGSLEAVSPEKNTLYLAEEQFNAPFSAARALSRNRIIHALGEKTFVAQCALETGGTWDGTAQNLKRGYSPVFCYDDGSPASLALRAMGADLVTADMLQNFQDLKPQKIAFL